MILAFNQVSAIGDVLGWIGRIAVFAGCFSFILASISSFINRKKSDKQKTPSALFYLGGLFTLIAMICLVSILLRREYGFHYVWKNTENDMLLMYRISAAWADQEGSFLLWSLTSAAIACLALRHTGKYKPIFILISGVALATMLGILSYESPYRLTDTSGVPVEQLPLALADGRGLNPVLQNYWMAIHPWVIFIGFGSLVTLFAWGASAIYTKDLKNWVPLVRPWAVFSMTVLGIGLIMGGLWAYETLGWGGFWAWDPVENVSLVPFVGSAVLVHGLMLQQDRGSWKKANTLLAMLPFIWFVYGTYLTRSGALNLVSVHSFAEMNQGAHALLLGLVIASVVFFIISAVVNFLSKQTTEIESKPYGHRSLGITIGMIFLYSIGLMAAIGMSVPFFALLFGDRAEVVTEGKYNQIVTIPFVVTLIFMAITPFLGWTKTAKERINALSTSFFVSVLFFGIVVWFLVRNGLTLELPDNQTFSGESPPLRMPFLQLALFLSLIWICVFTIVTNGRRMFERLRARTGGTGAFLTHSGVAILLLGLIVSRAFEKSDFTLVKLSQQGTIGLVPGKGYLASLNRVPSVQDIIDKNNRISFTLIDVYKPERTFDFQPNLYFSERQGQWMIRPDIRRFPLYDLYFVTNKPEVEFASEIQLSPGQEVESGLFKIKMIEKTQEGEPGHLGTKFGALLQVEYDAKVFEVNPKIEITASGIQSHPAAAGEHLIVAIDRVVAGQDTVEISLLPPEPFFPVQVFYKPLTILVWIGAGMMTLGGAFTINRRRLSAKLQKENENAVDQTP